MKKLLMAIICIITTAITAQAQTEVKVKPTTTPVQKVHNMTHRNKHHKGYKVKSKTPETSDKMKVNNRTGEVKEK